jgi:hypothetical protein
MVLSHPQYTEYEVLIDSKMVCLFFCFYQNVSIFKDQNKRSWGTSKFMYKDIQKGTGSLTK